MIHSSAIVSKDAEIHETSNIGPFCIVGNGVKIGKNNNLISNVSIVGDTIIKDDNTFYPFCSIGSEPQDLKYNKENWLSCLFFSNLTSSISSLLISIICFISLLSFIFNNKSVSKRCENIA